MKRILLSTAAVLASVTLAAAQGGPQQSNEKQLPAAASERAQQNAPDQSKGDQRPQRDSRPAEQEKGAQQTSPGGKDKAPGPVERLKGDDAKRDAQQKGGDDDAQKADSKRDAQQQPRDRDAQKTDTKVDRVRDGQGQRKPSQAKDQRERDRDQQQDTNRQKGTSEQSPTASRSDRVQTDAQGRVTLDSQQRTRIQQTVFTRSDVPRVSRVDFSVTVGTAVPSHVTIVDVPPALIEINPEWHGYRYFVVEEEIVIVTPERRIVAVVPVGRSQAGPSGGGGVVAELPEAEVRILQQVLVERGFSVEVDGVWGPRTREAIISFQRKEGLQATGQIDTRTVTALGVQGRVNVQGDSGTNAGREGRSGRQEQPTAQTPSSQQPAQNQGNQRPADERQNTTGTGDVRQNGQSDNPVKGSATEKLPETGRPDAPASRGAPNKSEPRRGGDQN